MEKSAKGISYICILHTHVLPLLCIGFFPAMVWWSLSSAVVLRSHWRWYIPCFIPFRSQYFQYSWANDSMSSQKWRNATEKVKLRIDDESENHLLHDENHQWNEIALHSTLLRSAYIKGESKEKLPNILLLWKSKMKCKEQNKRFANASRSDSWGWMNS